MRLMPKKQVVQLTVIMDLIVLFVGSNHIAFLSVNSRIETKHVNVESVNSGRFLHYIVYIHPIICANNHASYRVFDALSHSIKLCFDAEQTKNSKFIKLTTLQTAIDNSFLCKTVGDS